MHEIKQIAVILNAASPFQRKIIRGVAAYAKESGCWSLYVEEDPLDKLPDLRIWHGNGIIVSFLEQKHVDAIRGLNIPVVAVEGGYGLYELDSGIPYLKSDDEAIAHMAVEHLVGQGFSRLAYCGVPRNRFTVWSTNRARAFRKLAIDMGIPYSSYSGRTMSVRKWDKLQQSLTEWLISLKKPVGILAANDARARHLLEACHMIGAHVPDEIAVMGVDNDDLMCEWTDPPLTSIEQGARNLGYLAASMLDKMMAGEKVPRIANYVKPEKVVCRRSTDYLAIEDEDVANALQFIRQHAWEHISVTDVLNEIGISRSTLESRFRKILHRTIHSEIQRVMIMRAQQLIATDMPLKQVAAEAGFSHIQHLTNLFRQRLGYTPGEYQRMVRNGLIKASPP